MTSVDIETPIAIVGGGHVGLCLALFLDYWGVKWTIFNKEPGARIHPKGNGQNARTMEHYRQLGFSDEIRKLGLPNDHPFDQVFFTRFCSHEIHRYPAPSWNERKKERNRSNPTDQFPEPMFHVNQLYVEAYLLERVRRCQGVDVRFGWEGIGFDETDEGVRITARRVEGGDEVAWQAKYMIDCSGGRSFIRRKLGIDYAGDVQTKDAMWAGQFYTVWLRIPELYSKYLGHRTAWMYWAVNPDPHTRGVLVALNGKDEFELMIKPGSGANEVDPDEIKSWIRQSIGDDIEVEVLSGLGMPTGIDDAHNLAWKLAAMLQGWGGPGLVDSYELERRPIGFRNTGAARKYSSKWHDPEIPDNIEADSPDGEAARKKAPSISYIANNHFNVPEEEDCTGVQLGARYDDSPLILRDSPAPVDSFPETYNYYHPSSVPGGRTPHLWLDIEREMGCSLCDKLGKGFTLLRIRSSIDTAGLVEVAEKRGIPLQVPDVELCEAGKLYDRPLVLVRPDQYIAWRGYALPDCSALLDHVCGFNGSVDEFAIQTKL